MQITYMYLVMASKNIRIDSVSCDHAQVVVVVVSSIGASPLLFTVHG